MAYFSSLSPSTVHRTMEPESPFQIVYSSTILATHQEPVKAAIDHIKANPPMHYEGQKLVANPEGHNLKMEFDTMRAQITQLFDRLASHGEMLSGQKEELVTVKRELTAQNEKLAATEKELTTQNEKLATAERELTSQNEKLATAERELTSQNEKLAMQDQRLVRLDEVVRVNVFLPRLFGSQKVRQRTLEEWRVLFSNGSYNSRDPTIVQPANEYVHGGNITSDVEAIDDVERQQGVTHQEWRTAFQQAYGLDFQSAKDLDVYNTPYPVFLMLNTIATIRTMGCYRAYKAQDRNTIETKAMDIISRWRQLPPERRNGAFDAEGELMHDNIQWRNL